MIWKPLIVSFFFILFYGLISLTMIEHTHPTIDRIVGNLDAVFSWFVLTK